MNKRLSTLITGVALISSMLTVTSSLFAAQPGLYFGAGAGQVDDELLNETDSGFKVFVGANLTPMLGLEASYIDLGSYANGALTQEGLAYEVVGYIPLTHQLDLYGKAGIFNWEVADATTTVTGTDPTFGLGVNVRINPNASLRGEWQTFLDVDGGDVEYYSASLSFNF